MTTSIFPAVDLADSDGLLAIGGDLSVATLVDAYSHGIFLWPINEQVLTWFAPPRRSIIFYENFHLSKSLKRFLARNPYQIKFNSDFRAVIQACRDASNRKGHGGSWITSQMIPAYSRLQQAGYAHSVESYLDGQLVGGVYGVSIGQMFAAESMFYREDNASKVALFYLIEALHRQGVNWVDTQVINPFTKSMGACVISRKKFMVQLEAAIGQPQIIFP